MSPPVRDPKARPPPSHGSGADRVPVVDASVVVALHHAADKFHHRCTKWLGEALTHGVALQAPGLLIVEVAAAIRRLTGDEELAAESIRELADWLQLFPLDHRRAEAAAALAARTGVRGADAVYLALARELREPLVTLDRQQLERGEALVEVQRPPVN